MSEAIGKMLTQTAEYALRVVLFIATEGKGEPIRVDTIAEELAVPRNYISKVMHSLGQSGLLSSTRGPRGGFVLARPAEEITLAEVIDRFDPLEDRCLLMRRRCSDAEPCMAHHRWREVAVQLRAFFRETTVADIVRSQDGPEPVIRPG
jgi:Rrf2 family protein